MSRSANENEFTDYEVFNTPDGGIAVQLINDTGAPSVAGTVVQLSSSTRGAALISNSRPLPVGVVYESGIPVGSLMWVVFAGVAEVLFGGAATFGQIARCFTASDTLGYAAGLALAETPGLTAVGDVGLFYIGSVLESRNDAGLVRVLLRFARDYEGRFEKIFNYTGVADVENVFTLDAENLKERKFTIETVNDKKQVESTAVVGTIINPGNAKVVVTCTGMTGTPKTITAAVVAEETADQVAAKLRAALQSDTAVMAMWLVSGEGANIVLTRLVNAANIANANMAIANDTCTGLTSVPSSTNTETGGVEDKSIAVDNLPGRCHIVLELKCTAVPTLTWMTGVTWDGGNAPTLVAGKTYMIDLYTNDAGTTWLGDEIGNW